MITERQQSVLNYLKGCQRASKRAIRSATGAGPNTLVALTGRGLIYLSGTQYRLTDAGREAAK